MSREAMIEVTGLVKKYRRISPDSNWKTGIREGLGRQEKKYTKALDGIGLEIRKGEIIGVLGPNGAGKTTMLKVLAGFIYPDGGEVKVNGFDVIDDRHEVRCSCNFLRSGGWVVFDYKYPLDQLLEFWGCFMGLKKEDARKAALRVLKTVGLEEKKKDFIENLSAGMRQRLNLARCLLIQRPIYLLDEPTDNLDPYSRDFILKFVKEELADKGTTIVLATHNLWEAEKVCDRLVILDEGKILRVGTVDEIKREASDERLVLRLGGDPGPVVAQISKLGFVVDVQTPKEHVIEGRKEKNVLLVYGKGLHANISEILQLTDRISKPKYLDIQTPSLNEIFVQIINDRKGGGGAG